MNPEETLEILPIPETTHSLLIFRDKETGSKLWTFALPAEPVILLRDAILQWHKQYMEEKSAHDRTTN